MGLSFSASSSTLALAAAAAAAAALDSLAAAFMGTSSASVPLAAHRDLRALLPHRTIPQSRGTESSLARARWAAMTSGGSCGAAAAERPLLLLLLLPEERLLAPETEDEVRASERERPERGREDEALFFVVVALFSFISLPSSFSLSEESSNKIPARAAAPPAAAAWASLAGQPLQSEERAPKASSPPPRPRPIAADGANGDEEKEAATAAAWGTRAATAPAAPRDSAVEGSSATFLSVRRRRRVRWESGFLVGGDFFEDLGSPPLRSFLCAAEAAVAEAEAEVEEEEARRSLSSAEQTGGSASALLAPVSPHERTSSRLAARSTNAASARGSSGHGEDTAISAVATAAAAAAVVLVLCRGNSDSRTPTE